MKGLYFLEEAKEKITSISTQMSIVALLIASTLNPVEADEIDIELPNTLIEKSIIEVNTDKVIMDYDTIIKEKKDGIYNTGLGEVALIFSLQNKDLFLQNLKMTYGLEDTSEVEYALRPQVSGGSPEIRFMRIAYGDKENPSYIKLVKYDQGAENGNHIDEYNSIQYKNMKNGFSRYDSLNKNLEEFIMYHEIYHSPQIMWNKKMSLSEFFADYSAILTIGLNNDMNYEEVKKMLSQNRQKRKSDALQQGDNDHFSEKLYNLNTFKKIIPNEEEFNDLKDKYKKALKESDKPLMEIAKFVSKKMNKYSDESINTKKLIY